MTKTIFFSPPRVFVDTGAFLAVYDTRDACHETAIQFRDDALLKRRVELYSSFYVLIETLEHLKRIHEAGRIRRETFWQAALELINATFFSFLAIDGAINGRAHQIVRACDRRFSYVDATTLALLERENIRMIFSFDSGFDWFPMRVGHTRVSLRTLPSLDHDLI